MLKLNQKTISSLEIAEITGKSHDNVLKSIRSMEDDWKIITGVKFNASKYNDKTGRKLDMYILNRSECLYISSKYNNQIRAKLVLKFEQSSDTDAEIAADRDYIKKLYLELNSLEDANKSNNKRIKEIRAIVKEVSLKDYSTPNLFLQN